MDTTTETKSTKDTRESASGSKSRQSPNRSNRSAAQSNSQDHPDLREQVALVRQDVRDLAAAAGAAATERLDPLQEYVREKPLKSMLIAAGIGALMGAIFLRR